MSLIRPRHSYAFLLTLLVGLPFTPASPPVPSKYKIKPLCPPVPHYLPYIAIFLLSFLSISVRAATCSVPSQYPTIQAGVNAAVDGDTVLVADGTYSGPGNRDIDFNGKSLTVTSQHGAASTIIDCGGYVSTDGSGNHRGFYLHSGEKVATISGFTVKNGYETYVFSSNDLSNDNGGGIYSYNSGTLTLTNCTVSGNTVGYSGGGIYNFNSGGTTTLTNCTVSGNTAGNGGGICNGISGGTITLTNCTVSGNTAGNGGGICNGISGGTITLTNCTVSGNTATYNGGGICNFGNSSGYIDSSVTTLTNCAVFSNTASDGGGVYSYLYSDINTIKLINSTVSANIGGGFCNTHGSGGLGSVILTNSILYSDTGGEVISPGGEGGVSTYGVTSASCDIQGGYPGTGNIDKDPLFVNFALGDLHLKPGSPCLGSGTPDGAPATDLDGNPRPNPPSMGAYELAAPAFALNITSARMVSDHKLAVTTKRIFGTSTYSVIVKIGLKDANGNPLSLSQNLTTYSGLSSGDQNPFVFDFKQLNVPRFTKNQRFTVTAEVIKDSSGYVCDTKDMIIWLPVVLVPGIVGPANFSGNPDHPAGGDGTFPDTEAFLQQKSQKFLSDNNCLGEAYTLFSTTNAFKYPTLSTLPYDRDNDSFAVGATKLTNLIGLIKLYTWADKVNLVTHSKGGLIARAYLEYKGDPKQTLPASANTVSRLIMTVPPNTGSLEAKLDLISYAAYFNGGLINLSNLYPLWKTYRTTPLQKFIVWGKPNTELGDLDGDQMNLPPKISYTIIYSDKEPTPETFTAKQFIVNKIPYVGVTVGDSVVPYYSQLGLIYDPNDSNGPSTMIHPFQGVLINHLNVPGFHSAIPGLQKVSYLELPDVEAEVFAEVSGGF